MTVPTIRHVAQPPSAVFRRRRKEDTAEGGCATTDETILLVARETNDDGRNYSNPRTCGAGPAAGGQSRVATGGAAAQARSAAGVEGRERGDEPAPCRRDRRCTVGAG